VSGLIMSERSKSNGDRAALADILEGVDAIGSIIDETLPRLEQMLDETSRRLSQLEEELRIGDQQSSDSGAADEQLSERLDLVEQRLLSLDQSSRTRLAELAELVDILTESLTAVHKKLDLILDQPSHPPD
jgi:hypothetical protein